MSIEFRLLPLDCPTCGAGMSAEGEDVIYYCTACRNGYDFDAEARSMRPVDVSFVAVANRVVESYKPFWLLPAQVTMHERTAKGGGFVGLMNFFFSQSKPQTSTSEGTFVVPAFHAPLDAVSELTRRYTEALPDLGEKLGERLLGGRYGIEDARKLAHFALIATEVGKPDTLTRLRYDIEFGSARLLGVPFVHRGEALEDVVFRIPVGEG